MENLVDLYLNNKIELLKEKLKDKPEIIKLLDQDNNHDNNNDFNKVFEDFIKEKEFNELINDKEKMKKIINYYHQPRLALQDDNVMKLLMETIKINSNKKE